MSNEIPCILNPDLACPENCRLHSVATQTFEALCKIFAKTPQEELAILRSSGPDKLDLRATNARDLRDGGVVDQCEHYPEAEYTPKIG